MPSMIGRTEPEACFQTQRSELNLLLYRSKLCPRRKKGERRKLLMDTPLPRGSPSERRKTAIQQGLCGGRALLSPTRMRPDTCVCRQIPRSKECDMSLSSRDIAFILENTLGAKGQGCWKNSVVILFSRLRLEMVFILLRNEAVVTEELAMSCSKRRREAVRLTKNGSLGCGLTPGPRKRGWG